MWIQCYRLKLSDLSFGKSSENNDRLSSVLYYTWIFNAQSKYQTLKRNLWVTQCNIYHRYQWISIINSYRPNFSKEKNQSCYFKNTFIVKTVSEFYFLKHWISKNTRRFPKKEYKIINFTMYRINVIFCGWKML